MLAHPRPFSIYYNDVLLELLNELQTVVTKVGVFPQIDSFIVKNSSQNW